MLDHNHLDVRYVARGREEEVDEGGGEWLPALVVGELLEERGRDALCRRACELPADEDRVDGAADVVGDDVAGDLRLSRLRVDLDGGEVRPEGEDETLLLVGADALDAVLGEPRGRRFELQLLRRPLSGLDAQIAGRTGRMTAWLDSRAAEAAT